MLKRALIAISLANLCFIPAWREILDPGSDFYCYHRKACPVGAKLTALTFDTLLLALVFFVAALIVSRARRPLLVKLAQLGFLFIFLIPLNLFRNQFTSLQGPALVARLGKAALVVVILALLLAAVFALYRLGVRSLAKAVAAVVLILSPFVLVAYAQAITFLVKVHAAEATDSVGELSAGAPVVREQSRRVVWLIFDEMDYRVAFQDRPATLKLPEFDRIRGQALFAANSYPPASSTLMSIPALVTGRTVVDASYLSPNELAIKFEGGAEKVDWSTQPNIFARARQEGFTTAIVGTYHPYCRLFGKDLTACSWQPTIDMLLTQKLSVRQNMTRQAKRSFFFLLARFLPKPPEDNLAIDPEERLFEVQNYPLILDDAQKAASNPGLNLVFVHMAIPHPPSFYDRAKGELSKKRGGSYLDSLALVDRTMGELRAAMERAGVWDTTTVLISSDHWWRAFEMWDPRTGLAKYSAWWTKEDEMISNGKVEHRIPFILKLAGQKEGVVYEPAFNTLVSHDLVLAILRGELASPESVVNWIDRQRAAAAPPAASP